MPSNPRTDPYTVYNDTVASGYTGGSGWIAEPLPYCLHFDVTQLKTAGVQAIQPNPVLYKRPKLVGQSGAGRPIFTGFPTTTWQFEWVSGTQWASWIWIRNVAEAFYNGYVYIVSRAEDHTLNNVGINWVQWQPVYNTYRCYIASIEGTPAPNYAFKSVKIEFTHLEVWPS